MYDRGEVFWLETKWLLLRLFMYKTYVHELPIANAFDPGTLLLVMPRANLLQYKDYTGVSTYRYERIAHNKYVLFRSTVNRDDFRPACEDTATRIKLAEESAFYEDVDRAVS